MKRRVTLWLIFIVLAFVVMVGCAKGASKLQIKSKAASMAVDLNNTKELPKHFRKVNDKINTEASKLPNLEGLADLKASGSAQFSEEGLKLVKQAIGESMSITVVDLRQELHGFVNGMAVSLGGGNNNGTKVLTIEELAADEKSKLKTIPLGKSLAFNNKNNVTVVPTKVENEEELVNSEGMSYIRIPVIDGKKPTNDRVDYFIQFAKSTLEDRWLHFHCRQGIGRTTTFMVMYDIMKNCKKVTLEDIIDRQVLIGGKNLMEDTKKIEVYAIKRSEFIEEFYKYCKENKDNYETTWSQWFQKNHR